MDFSKMMCPIFMKVFAELFSKSDRNYSYLLASSMATATATVIPTMGLLPAPNARFTRGGVSKKPSQIF